LVPESDTRPTPGVMEMEVAPVTCHCKVDFPPKGMTVGLAENRLIKGCPVSAITVTVTEAVMEPAPLVAVKVYFLVVAGDTFRFPSDATAPTPWSMEMDVAPPTCHCKVAKPPGLMLVGYTEKRSITGSAVDWVRLTVVEALMEPELLVAVKV